MEALTLIIAALIPGAIGWRMYKRALRTADLMDAVARRDQQVAFLCDQLSSIAHEAGDAGHDGIVAQALDAIAAVEVRS